MLNRSEYKIKDTTDIKMPGGGGLMELVAVSQTDSMFYNSSSSSIFRDEYFYNKHSQSSKKFTKITSETFVYSLDKTNECYIDCKCDLISKIYLEMYIPTQTNSIYKLFNSITFSIDGKVIKTIYGKHEFVKKLLTHNLYNIPESGNGIDVNGNSCTYLYTELELFDYIPVIAMKSIGNIKVNIDKNLGNLQDVKTNIIVKGIYLDTLERRKCAQTLHQIPFRQYQHRQFIKEKNIENFKYKIECDNSIEYFVITFSKEDGSLLDKEILKSMKLTLNGHQREENISSQFYRFLQPSYQNLNNLPNGTYFYSFSQDININNVTSTLCLSRIDSPFLQFEFIMAEKIIVDIYLANRNIFILDLVDNKLSYKLHD